MVMGAWECRHGVDGRDDCGECRRPAMTAAHAEAILTRVRGSIDLFIGPEMAAVLWLLDEARAGRDRLEREAAEVVRCLTGERNDDLRDERDGLRHDLAEQVEARSALAAELTELTGRTGALRRDVSAHKQSVDRLVARVTDVVRENLELAAERDKLTAAVVQLEEEAERDGEELGDVIKERDRLAGQITQMQVELVRRAYLAGLGAQPGGGGVLKHCAEAGTPPKLVRDLIPGIATANGDVMRTRTAEPAEMPGLLDRKLLEEVGEYVADDDPAELADVLEVLLARAAEQGISPGRLEEMRAAKAAGCGVFKARLVWLGDDDG